jgi:hypothetical protein
MANVYTLRFERIDNQVKIVINNVVAWDSGVIQQNPHLDILVVLDPYFQPGDNPITVQLYNAPQQPGITKPCAVHYRIEINGVEAGETDNRGGEQPAGLVIQA